MIRALLTFVVPLVAPIVVYFVYLAIADWFGRRAVVAKPKAPDGREDEPGERENPGGAEDPEEDESLAVVRTVPWLWLAGIGVVLTMISAVWFADFDREPPGGVYVPPQMIDGRIVPGHVVPAAESEAGPSETGDAQGGDE